MSNEKTEKDVPCCFAVVDNPGFVDGFCEKTQISGDTRDKARKDLNQNTRIYEKTPQKRQHEYNHATHTHTHTHTSHTHCSALQCIAVSHK